MNPVIRNKKILKYLKQNIMVMLILFYTLLFSTDLQSRNQIEIEVNEKEGKMIKSVAKINDNCMVYILSSNNNDCCY